MMKWRLSDLPEPPPGRTGWPWTAEREPPAKDPCGDGWPRISVITPSLNQAAYLEETIRSVLLQSYPNFEYVIIDAGSTDGSLDIIRKYSRFIDRWVSEKDRGQSDAINKGARMASGEFLGWLNSDDALFPGALRAMGRAFRENAGADVIYGAGAKINAHGETTKEIGFRAFDARRIGRQFFILQPSMFFRRDSFLRVGGLTLDSHYAMDWELILKLMPFARIVAIPDKIGKLRDYPATKTRTGGWPRMREIAGIGRKFHGRTDRNYLIFAVKERIARITKRRQLRALTDRTLVALFGYHGYMIHEWPA